MPSGERGCFVGSQRAGKAAVGFVTRVEAPRGGDFDDTTLNGMRLLCADYDYSKNR